MSWHGPSAPRVEGIATKSLMIANWSSKPTSTASRILCCVSVVMRRLQSGISGTRSSYPNPILADGVMQKMGLPQGIIEQAAFRIGPQRFRPFDTLKQPRTRFRRADHGAHRNPLGINRQRIVLLIVGDA